MMNILSPGEVELKKNRLRVFRHLQLISRNTVQRTEQSPVSCPISHRRERSYEIYKLVFQSKCYHHPFSSSYECLSSMILSIISSWAMYTSVKFWLIDETLSGPKKGKQVAHIVNDGYIWGSSLIIFCEKLTSRAISFTQDIQILLQKKAQRQM